MSEPKPPVDLEEVRKRHVALPVPYRDGYACKECRFTPKHPCDVLQLADEVERLRSNWDLERTLFSDEIDRMAWFIRSEGYVPCDIPACNCPYWHGGNANRRLREIADELGTERTNGTTILGAVRELIDEREREIRAAVEAERERCISAVRRTDCSRIASVFSDDNGDVVATFEQIVGATLEYAEAAIRQSPTDEEEEQ